LTGRKMMVLEERGEKDNGDDESLASASNISESTANADPAKVHRID